MVAAWETAPSAAIGRLLERVDAQLPTPSPIEAPTVAGREARWHELAATHDAAYLRTLLATAWPLTIEQMRARVDALAKWPRSPRISTALLGQLARGLRGYHDRDVAAAIVALLAKQGDPAIAEYLAKLAGEPGRPTALFRDYLMRSLGEATLVEPTLARDDSDALAAIEAVLAPGLARHARTLDELLADVYANPHDDGPRLVIADVLSERGDPRGELILLQVRRSADPADPPPSRRERELLRQAGRRWYDGLDGDGARKVKIERGFPAAALAGSSKFTASGWGSIETLQLHSRNTPFRGSPLLTSLCTLQNVRGARVPEIELPRDLDALWLADVFEARLDRPSKIAPRVFGIEDLGGATRRPISELHRRIAELHDAPLGRRVTSLHFGHQSFGVAGLFGLFELAPWLDELSIDGRFDPFPAYRSHYWAYRIVRGGALELEWLGAPHAADSAFARIASELREVELPVTAVRARGVADVSPETVARTRDELARIVGGWPDVTTVELFDERRDG